MTLKKHLRFEDLKALGIVRNRTTLGRWIRSNGFPPGKMVGPNTRIWTDAEIAAWQESVAPSRPDAA